MEIGVEGVDIVEIAAEAEEVVLVVIALRELVITVGNLGICQEIARIRIK